VSNLNLVLDAGHAGFGVTSGKRTPDGEYEWDFNNKQLLACQKYLSNYEGVNILRVDDPTGKRDIPLEERTDNSNRFGADAYISFHNNALDDDWDNHQGMETFTYSGSNPKSEKLQVCIHKHLIKATKNTDRGMKEANFHVLRETRNCAAVLTESFFMDSLSDIKKLRDDNVLRETGEAIAKGIVECYGLRRKESVKVAEKVNVNEPSKWAKDHWNESVKNGYFDGTRPQDPISREEVAIVINRLRGNFLSLINKRG
jgi:N-acetylmuramoyl-L-alanine amidase